MTRGRRRDAASVEALLGELRASNPVSRGLLLPDGEAASLDGVRAALGFAPSWLEAGATQAHKLRAPVLARLRAPRSPAATPTAS